MSRVELPDDVIRLAEAQVAAGRARSIEEVLRAGIAALEHEQEKLEALRAAIDEGDASGVYDGDPFNAVRAKHRLPTS